MSEQVNPYDYWIEKYEREAITAAALRGAMADALRHAKAAGLPMPRREVLSYLCRVVWFKVNHSFVVQFYDGKWQHTDPWKGWVTATLRTCVSKAKEFLEEKGE